VNVYVDAICTNERLHNSQYTHSQSVNAALTCTHQVVKLLGSLVPEEPRLARKLLEPLATIIRNTTAKSLLYECIHTVTLALPYTRKEDGSDAKSVPAIVALCSDNLKQFVQDPDQNLKYLGLVGFLNLMASHPRAVAESRDLILGCLNDDDITIRTRALELLTGMVTKRSLQVSVCV
jgi:AP-3 complex subunit delta-1